MAKTKREYFAELKAIVGTNEELIAFIDHEVELLDRKNSAPKAPTAKQVENEKIKDVILAGLVEPMTASDITKNVVNAVDAYADVKVQRVSALLTQLIEDNSVVRTVVKRKAYFSVA